MKYMIPVLLSLMLLSCGEEESEKRKSNPNIIQMEIGKSYTVNSGDTLNKTSKNALVSINEHYKTKVKTIILTQGSATITRAK